MKNIAIDFSYFVYGRAAGFNEFTYALLDGLASIKTSDIKITLIIRKDQQKHFRHYEKYFSFFFINAKNVFSRMLLQNIILPLQSQFDFFVFTGNIAPVFMTKPYLLVIHDLNYIYHPENFRYIDYCLRKVLTKISIKKAKVSVSISNTVANEVWHFFRKTSVVIYNPVRVSSKKSVAFEPPYKILCMTSLAAHKNIREAYKAFIKFVTLNPFVEFDLIGNWNVEDFPSSIRHPKIRLHGYVENSVKRNLLDAASCIIAPSVYEGFGMPYAEAMVMGKCLVCSNIPIAKEIAKNYPYYIDEPYLEKDILNALNSAFDNQFKPRDIDLSHIAQFDSKVAAANYLNVILTNLYI